MIEDSNIVVFDLETGGLRFDYHEAVSVAGKAYDGRTLQPYPISSGGEFSAFMKPLYFDRLEPEALKVNGITKEQLEQAPDQKAVWNQFVEWVGRWNKGKSSYTAPIAGGKNIRSFDLKFVEVLNKLHCPKKEKTVLFSPRYQIDLEDFILTWFSKKDIPNMKMDTLREYFGLSKEGAHSSLIDTRQTGELLMKFLKVQRVMRQRTMANGEPLVKFKGACVKEAQPL